MGSNGPLLHRLPLNHFFPTLEEADTAFEPLTFGLSREDAIKRLEGLIPDGVEYFVSRNGQLKKLSGNLLEIRIYEDSPPDVEPLARKVLSLRSVRSLYGVPPGIENMPYLEKIALPEDEESGRAMRNESGRSVVYEELAFRQMARRGWIGGREVLSIPVYGGDISVRLVRESMASEVPVSTGGDKTLLHKIGSFFIAPFERWINRKTAEEEKGLEAKTAEYRWLPPPDDPVPPDVAERLLVDRITGTLHDCSNITKNETVIIKASLLAHTARNKLADVIRAKILELKEDRNTAEAEGEGEDVFLEDEGESGILLDEGEFLAYPMEDRCRLAWRFVAATAGGGSYTVFVDAESLEVLAAESSAVNANKVKIGYCFGESMFPPPAAKGAPAPLPWRAEPLWEGDLEESGLFTFSSVSRYNFSPTSTLDEYLAINLGTASPAIQSGIDALRSTVTEQELSLVGGSGVWVTPNRDQPETALTDAGRKYLEKLASDSGRLAQLEFNVERVLTWWKDTLKRSSCDKNGGDVIAFVARNYVTVRGKDEDAKDTDTKVRFCPFGSSTAYTGEKGRCRMALTNGQMADYDTLAHEFGHLVFHQIRHSSGNCLALDEALADFFALVSSNTLDSRLGDPNGAGCIRNIDQPNCRPPASANCESSESDCHRNSLVFSTALWDILKRVFCATAPAGTSASMITPACANDMASFVYMTIASDKNFWPDSSFEYAAVALRDRASLVFCETKWRDVQKKSFTHPKKWMVTEMVDIFAEHGIDIRFLEKTDTLRPKGEKAIKKAQIGEGAKASVEFSWRYPEELLDGVSYFALSAIGDNGAVVNERVSNVTSAVQKTLLRISQGAGVQDGKTTISWSHDLPYEPGASFDWSVKACRGTPPGSQADLASAAVREGEEGAVQEGESYVSCSGADSDQFVFVPEEELFVHPLQKETIDIPFERRYESNLYEIYIPVLGDEGKGVEKADIGLETRTGEGSIDVSFAKVGDDVLRGTAEGMTRHGDWFGGAISRSSGYGEEFKGTLPNLIKVVVRKGSSEKYRDVPFAGHLRIDVKYPDKIFVKPLGLDAAGASLNPVGTNEVSADVSKATTRDKHYYFIPLAPTIPGFLGVGFNIDVELEPKGGPLRIYRQLGEYRYVGDIEGFRSMRKEDLGVGGYSIRQSNNPAFDYPKAFVIEVDNSEYGPLHGHFKVSMEGKLSTFSCACTEGVHRSHCQGETRYDERALWLRTSFDPQAGGWIAGPNNSLPDEYFLWNERGCACSDREQRIEGDNFVWAIICECPEGSSLDLSGYLVDAGKRICPGDYGRTCHFQYTFPATGECKKPDEPPPAPEPPPPAPEPPPSPEPTTEDEPPPPPSCDDFAQQACTGLYDDPCGNMYSTGLPFSSCTNDFRVVCEYFRENACSCSESSCRGENATLCGQGAAQLNRWMTLAVMAKASCQMQTWR